MGHNNKCFVPNCKTGYNSCEKKYSLFSAPKNEKLRKLWDKAICRADRKLSDNDVVCAKHFLNTDIIKEWISGHVTIPYKKPRLKKSAVPSIFSYKIPFNEYDKTKRKTRQNLRPRKSTSVAVSNTKKSKLAVNVFKQLWQNRDVLKMPNAEWTLHYIDKNKMKNILITECTVTDDGVPSLLRNMVIDEDIKLKSFIGSVEITKNALNKLSFNSTHFTNITEIQTYLNSFSDTTICAGGPSAKVHSLDEITIGIAKIDVNDFWRHTSCPLILSGSDQRCTWCKGVYDHCINYLLSLSS